MAGRAFLLTEPYVASPGKEDIDRLLGGPGQEADWKSAEAQAQVITNHLLVYL
jgi:hypothetical protein